MIRVSEILSGPECVRIRVDGVLDRQTIPILQDVFRRHVQSKERIELHLEDLVNISREGIRFLRQLDRKFILVDPPWMVEAEPD